MVRTVPVHAGAIARRVFFAVVATGGGLGAACAPDLGRVEGTVVVRAAAPVPDATRYRASIEVGDQQTSAEGPTTGPYELTGDPAGPATVGLEAWRGETRLAAETRTLRVQPGRQELVLALGGAVAGADGGTAGAGDTGPADSGLPEVRSAPIPAVVRSLRDASVVGGRLAGRAELDRTALSAFAANATSRLGRAPTRLRVVRTEVELLLPGSQNLSSLDELWSAPIRVSLQGTGGPIAIAEGGVGAGTVRAELPATGGPSDVDPLLGDLDGGRIEVLIDGATDRTTADDFSAEVQILVSFVAG